jgi:ribosomal protein L27
VGLGGDYTLFALTDGKVSFSRRRNRKFAGVIPVAAPVEG